MIDKKAIRRYHKRVDARLAARGKRFDGNRWEENDHPRAKDGKFTSGSGSHGGKPKDAVHHSDPSERGGTGKKQSAGSKSWQEMTKADVKVNGPSESKKYVEAYFKEHPEVAKEAEKYKSVLSNVRDFKDKFPDAENYNSYDAVTGKKVNASSGYCVTFHQNYELGNEYGAYDDDTYAALCAIAINELKPEHMYIGYYDTIEISFNCPDSDKARAFAIEHNQHSVYSPETDSYWYNPYYDKKTNPLRMTEGT